MSVFLYPEEISFITKPLEKKLYAFRFSWTTTEPIGKESIEAGFDALLAWWQNTYDILIPHSILAIEGQIGAEIAFKPKSDLDVTLGDMWDFLDRNSSDYYLNLIFRKAVIYKPSTPWWVWLLLVVIVVGIIYALRKGKYIK